MNVPSLLSFSFLVMSLLVWLTNSLLAATPLGVISLFAGLQSGCFIESYLVMPVSIILCLIESYLVMPVSIIFQCLFTPTKVLLLILISLIRTFKWVISLLAAFLKLCLVSSGLAVLTTIVSPLAWGIDDVLDRFLHIVSTVASLPQPLHVGSNDVFICIGFVVETQMF